MSWNCKAVIQSFLQFDSQKRRIKMLERIENVNEQVIEKMFLLYEESMADMKGEFKDLDE